MNLLETLPSIQKIRPLFNVGGPFDIVTGTYTPGAHGEMILNGGHAHIVSIAGPANSFKTVIALFFNLNIAERYSGFQESIYDSENSLKYRRINTLAKRYPKMAAIDHGSETLEAKDVKFKITSAAEVAGDEYFDMVKAIHSTKMKERGKMMRKTPMVNSKGENITMINPTGILVDSLSALEISSLNEKMTDKNAIGASGNNTLYMKQGIAKKQLINQAMNIGPTGSIFFTFVAHIGDEFELDPYAPKKHKLTFAKRGSKVTGTTKAFEYINDVVYEIFNVSVLNNKERGTGVLYPNGDLDKEEETTDLLLVTLKTTRNKHGLTGISIDVILSQREGLLPHLTQFHYCKENNFGIVGNVQNYAMALYPDVKLSRTTVRGKIDEDPLLRRAIEITSQMLQIKQTWPALPDDLMCSPETLYNDLKLLGYHWPTLLQTRGYWVFEEDEEMELPYLSTMDLLRMRVGLYTPFWLEKNNK